MFIRKKQNKGGSFSILLQIGERPAGKKYPVSRTIKNFGSARSDKDIASLIAQAEAYKATLAEASPKAKALKVISELDVKSCHSYNTGFSEVYGQSFDHIFANLLLKPHLKNMLRDLAIMRIASPASKLKTTKLSSEYNINLQVDSIYKSMDQITTPIIDNIKKTI